MTETTRPNRLTKHQRQHRITRLLEAQAVTSQGQLVTLLADQGVEATQTTVSRDLEDLGAVKVRLPGGETAYALPELPVHQIAPEDHLRRVLGEWVVEVASSANLVVLRTPPGSAHVVGSALDRSGLDAVIGTVAGDDTVLVIVDEEVGGRAMADRLSDVAGIAGESRHAGQSSAAADEQYSRGRQYRRREQNRLAREGLKMAERVVLAYSGGLDTSVAVRWLIENEGVEVIAVAVDVGQAADKGGEDWDAIRQRALAAGAVEAVVVDARAEMAQDFCVPALAANARYEGKYPLVSALSRPVIVRHLVAEARRHGATAVAHGCTGKGNDQVRFEVGTRALAPDLSIYAPARVWGLSREDCVDLATKWDIPITVTKEKPYSIDENLWGRAIECGAIEDPWAPAPDDVYTLTRVTPPEPVEVIVGFEAGVPVALDGVPLAPQDLIAGSAPRPAVVGFGRLDMVENRRVGIKSREVYECPAALALMMAHATWRTSPSSVTSITRRPASSPAGPSWSTTACGSPRSSQALDAFIAESQRHVTGEVRLRFAAPGTCCAWSDAAARWRSTTTAWPPTTPPTPSATRTPRASCGSGAWASPPGRRARARERRRACPGRANHDAVARSHLHRHGRRPWRPSRSACPMTGSWRSTT